MPSPSFAPSAKRVPASRIRALADAAFGMEDVLFLQFGESTLPTPPYVIEAVNEAALEGWTFYSANQGLPSLRAAIAQQIAKLHQVDIDPSEIQVTSGGVQALNLAIKCVIDPGDEAIVLSPNWPNGSAMVEMFGGRAVEVPMARAGQRFTPDREALEAALTPRTRLLLYASPSNPLGWTATVAEQKMLLEFARHHGLWLLTDEVYERIFYGRHGAAEGEQSGPAGLGQLAPSILQLCSREDAVIVVNSFSKTYRMTGWRLGWMVGRTDFVQQAAQLNEFIVSHAPTMIQRGGEAAIATVRMTSRPWWRSFRSGAISVPRCCSACPASIYRSRKGPSISFRNLMALKTRSNSRWNSCERLMWPLPRAMLSATAAKVRSASVTRLEWMY